MIVVRIELWSARTGERSELGTIYIANDGDRTNVNPNRGDYIVKQARKGQKYEQAWTRPAREAKVLDHARLTLPVWSLVLKALQALGHKGDK